MEEKNQKSNIEDTQKSEIEDKKVEEVVKTSEQKVEDKPLEKIPKEEKVEEKKESKEKKKEIVKEKPKPKKSEAVINSFSLPISTKYSIAICKFIKRKRIGDAIRELEQVSKFKKVIPMKGEIPHKKGKKISSGRYVKKSTEHFIKILKNLLGNANNNGLDDPVITEAIANIASRPYGRFGRIRKKRTHVKIVVKERKILNKPKKEDKK